jgi:hypothetical protein
MFSLNPVGKVTKELSKIETLLIKTEDPSEILSLIKRVELLCSNVFGIPNSHTTFITNLKLQAIPNSEDAFKELTNQFILKGKVKLLDYINTNLKADLSYNKKFPCPLPFTEKMTPPWFFKNAGASTWSVLISLLISAYGVGVKYPLLGNTVSAIFSAKVGEPKIQPKILNNPPLLTKLASKGLPKQPPNKLHNEVIETSNKTLSNQ